MAPAIADGITPGIAPGMGPLVTPHAMGPLVTPHAMGPLVTPHGMGPWCVAPCAACTLYTGPRVRVRGFELGLGSDSGLGSIQG